MGPARQRRDVVECNSADPFDDGTWILEWTRRPARSFDYARILQGLANCDHRIEPWIDDRVYFVAPEKGLLFYMYDDRGLDMVATDRAVLAPLYQQLDHWLLDYDRERMRETFGDPPV